MTDAMFQAHDHPTPESLAELAERGGEDPRLLAHLGGCRRCMAIYAEFVESHLSRAAHQNEPPSDWLEQAVSIPRGAGTLAEPRKRVGPRIRIGAGAAVAAALAVLLLVLYERPSDGPGIPLDARNALVAQLQADSQGSLLYGDDLAPQPRGVRGGSGDEGAAGSALEHLLDLYRSGPPDADVAYWLVAGYLATNQLRNADPFLREALDRFPKDMRFLNLAAILDYKRNEMDKAETRLRGAAAVERRPEVLVNLAIIRRQQGAEEEAQALLEEALFRSPNATITPYIRQLTAESR